MSQHDDLFQQLGRTLEVAPSRDFADGVRSRIARRRMVMRTTMSGLAIAASLLLVVMVRWPEPAQPMAMTATAPAAVPPVVVASSHLESHGVAPLAAGVPVTSVPQSRRFNRVTPVAEPAAEPDPLRVVTNQMAVLRAAWAGHQVTAVETDAPPVDVMTVPEPAPIVVEPVRVLPVVIADHRTPIERLPIIRRGVAALETK